MFVAVFFLLALFFAPLAGMVPAYASAAALLYVACVMAQGLAEIAWDDITEYGPAVVAAVTMPLTYSIATGIGLGFITYAAAKIVSGKFDRGEAGRAGAGAAVRGEVLLGRIGDGMTTKGVTRFALAAGLALAVIHAGPARADELKIFGSRVTRMVIDDLGPGFERDTGHKLTVVTDVAAVMKRRIEQGEPFDLAVLVNFQADDLIRKGKLIADSRADVMKSGIGVAVRRGAPKPDISTVDAFKRTLLAAKSITYLKEGASTIRSIKVFAQLGIAEALRRKTIKPTPRRSPRWWRRARSSSASS